MDLDSDVLLPLHQTSWHHTILFYELTGRRHHTSATPSSYLEFVRRSHHSTTSVCFDETSCARRGVKLALIHSPRSYIPGRKMAPIVFLEVSGVNRRKQRRRCVEALQKCPCPAACASLWRQPSLLAMTHMRWVHGQSGHQSTGYTQSVVPLCR